MNATGTSRHRWRSRWLLLGLAVIALAAWGLLDVRRRAQLDPQHPEVHRTDFTVYTAAASALLAGDDPYATIGPRSWPYLYPPLFALLVSPLRQLTPPNQAIVWFAVSVTLAFGCFWECYRIGGTLWKEQRRGPTDNDNPRAHDDAAPPGWPGVLAFVAVLLPMLNCLQRGQVGLALLYPLLLGFRLAVLARSPALALLGGGVLALPIAIKITPILPVALLLLLLAVAFSWRRAATVMLGTLAGSALFWLFIPAAIIGWQPNLSHLGRWYDVVVEAQQTHLSRAVSVERVRNQSLASALGHVARSWQRRADAGVAEGADSELIPADDAAGLSPAWRLALAIARGGVLLLLLIGGLRLAWGGDALGLTAAFGLACVATLLISPISWGHHYVLLLPAATAVPLWLLERDRFRAAVVMGVLPVLLTLLHYVAVEQAGRIGLLGLGTTAYFVAAVLLAFARSAPNPSPKRKRGSTATVPRTQRSARTKP